MGDKSHSTGIADLKYSKFESMLIPKKGYITVAYDDERYVGTWDINRREHFNSVIKPQTATDEWLPCCLGGFFDMYTWDLNVNSAFSKERHL